MNSMLKIMLILGLAFASTFLILNVTGVISIERIQYWLDIAQNISPWVIAMVVIFLLFADLFVAMPTLTIMLLAGVSGYIVSNRFGDRLLRTLVRNDADRQDAIQSFRQYGTMTILLSRAIPILPEVSACMAGLTKMPIKRFLIFWLISSVPYAVIATYAGSISNLSNPQPAIYTAIGLSGFLWLSWFVFHRFKKQR